jgi:hypothetical protein
MNCIPAIQVKYASFKYVAVSFEMHIRSQGHTIRQEVTLGFTQVFFFKNSARPCKHTNIE